MYSKARSDKPSLAPSTSKPAVITSAAAPPVTPSKRASRQQEDSFKTPSRASATRSNGAALVGDANGAGPSQASGTQFAYAPSPSRLRALAASRSFSGSPNKKGGLAAQEAVRAAEDAPVNLGKSFVLPPTIDTPRTKAKRWLAGDAVSPPVKLRYSSVQSGSNGSGTGLASTSGTAQAPKLRTNGSKADFWQQVEQRRSATPAEEADTMETKLPNGTQGNANGASTSLGDDDDDFLAPSPVKPAPSKPYGKGKQRQRVDLFGNPAEDFNSANGTSHSLSIDASNGSRPTKKVQATPITSFFSAKPPITRVSSNGEESKKPYLPGPSKAKKRTIATAAIIPTVSEDFDKIEDPDVAPVQAESSTRLNVKASKKDSKAKKAEDTVVYQSERKKRPRKEIRPPQATEQDISMQDDNELYDDAYDPEVLEAIETQEQEDDYETRELSDEYDEFKPKRRSLTPASTLAHEGREASSAPLDDSLDPDLVSLLSLKASPVKNRLARLHKKREDTYRKLLLEPTYVMEAKREIRGLEDLEEEERRRREEEFGEVTERQWTSETAGDDPFGSQKAHVNGEQEEQSDDDWASEPEGWKDLSDGEMPEDSF